MVEAGSEWAALVDSIREPIRQALLQDLTDAGLPARLAVSLARSGQVNRGVLTILVGNALGAKFEKLTPLAVAIELIHRASVIHDDIQDGDSLRRGVPTTHAAEGLPLAVAISDVLLSRALGNVAALDDRDLLADTLATYGAMARGQLIDIAGPVGDSGAKGLGRAWTLPSELKTGSLVELAFRYGARSAHQEEQETSRWASVGLMCGSAFQLLNDVRNARAEEDRGPTGASDLAQGRFTSVSLVLNKHPQVQVGSLAERVSRACQIVEEEAMARMRTAADLLSAISPPGTSAHILSVLMTPNASRTFVLATHDTHYHHGG